MMRISLLVIAFSIIAACSSQPNASNGPKPSNNTNRPAVAPLPVFTYEVVKSYPHDPRAFTQGLIYHDGFLYESTGQEGRSTLRKVELETGKISQKHDLPREMFAEGLTLVGDKLYQITWQDNLAFEYSLDLKLLREMSYTGEGWGLADDGTSLIMSDGTHLLKIVDPQTFKTVRSLPVFQSPGKPLFLLNELEWVKGEIWANIWHSEQTETGTAQGRMPNIGRPNIIARIDPATGNVVGWIDLAGISPDDQPKPTSDPENYYDDPRSENTLNGIAYDEAGDRIFVTGKNWKKLYEIKIKPKS
jgi:glutaminyl-peptide cyclotransferase